MTRLLLSLALVAALATLSVAEDGVGHPVQEHAVEEAKPAEPLTALQLPSSLNLSHNMVQTLAVAGAVVVGLLGAGAILALLMPMFGFRMCYLFGTCDTYAHAYLAPTAYDAYAYSQPVYASAAGYAKSYDGASNDLPYSAYETYPQHSPQAVPQAVTYPSSNSLASNVYQKRSLEYVGPILKMLSNAYEKYNHPGQTKPIVESKQTSSAANVDAKSE